MSYAQITTMKPPLQVQVPTPTAPHTPEVLALPPNESDYGIPLLATVIRQLEAKDGSHTRG